jgi:signal transduction histidine kinase
VILSAFVPIGVIGAILAQGGFVLFVLPLMTVIVQLLIFTGVVHHRYYDIEVRAARTGDLATAAAEHDRLALLGELSATIAHEVRNPLTGIRSLTQLMAEPELDDDKRVRYAGVIMGEVTRLDRIVGNLTDLARRSAGAGVVQNGDTPVAPLFDDLMLLVESRARRSDVEVTATHTDVVVRAPREALAQALLNLILNAIAHAPPRSKVTLRAEHHADGSTLSVSDHGPGVAPEERSRIFEPFHTRGGTGLGLTVVRRLATEHGWTVGVGDAEGGGADFRIHIPDAA